jgi:hypothetical protein
MQRSPLLRRLPVALLVLALPGCGGDRSLGDPVALDLTVVPGVEGTIHSDGTVVPGGPYLVGDTAANVGQRALFRFSSAALPAGAVVESAQLRIHQSAVAGAPYAGLGDAILEHVSIDTGAGPGLDAADYGSAALSQGFAFVAGDPGLGYRVAEVAVALANDRAAGRTTHDFRLEHVLITDADATVDRTTWNDGADTVGNGNVPHLVVTYRLP